MNISLSTPVTLTMGKLLAAIAILLGASWALLEFTLSGVRDDIAGGRADVAAIRTDVGKLQAGLQGADKDNVVRADDINSKLTDQISGLRSDLTSQIGGLRIELTKLQDSLGSFSENLNKNMGEFNSRLEKFQQQIAYTQASWTDPKQVQAFVQEVQKASGGAQKIVIVPIIPGSIPNAHCTEPGSC